MGEKPDLHHQKVSWDVLSHLSYGDINQGTEDDLHPEDLVKTEEESDDEYVKILEKFSNKDLTSRIAKYSQHSRQKEKELLTGKHITQSQENLPALPSGINKIF